MTNWTSITGPIARPAFNVLVNAQAAYFASKFFNDDGCRDIAIIVAIDTAFRLAITHDLNAMKIPYLQTGVAGHLLFPCLTLLTQLLSVKVARTFCKLKYDWNGNDAFIVLFGYIALGWKMNMMVKDVVYLSFPSLKKI